MTGNKIWGGYSLKERIRDIIDWLCYGKSMMGE